ncbi:beta-lactamase family protein [Flavobacteriales bacterium]|jgi:CubicO group peptidase (beta-lactamase class C family)|nr:beta-lactamase family protein [Flavobacteriales bacterium]
MKTTRTILIIVAAVVALSYITGHGYIWGGLVETYARGWNNSNIDDIEFRDLRTIAAAENPSPWVAKKSWNMEFTEEEMAWHDEYMSASFLVLHGDTLLFEEYWQGHDHTTLTNSFSACKSIVALALGLAVSDGKVNVQNELADYLPRFAGDGGRGLTVQEALQMRSHIPFGEDYANPFGFMAKAYYRGDIQGLLEPYRVEETPGSEWKYEGGNTMLLGELIAGLDEGSLSQWVETRLWNPMGAQHDAFWGLDAPDEEGGIERCFAAYYATSRDYARFGKLINHQGNWNGKQLIDSTYMAEMLTPIAAMSDECDAEHYGYQIWLGETDSGMPFSCMEGLRGQMVISVPLLDLVVVRTGYKKDKRKEGPLPSDIRRVLNMALRLLEQ